MELEQKRNMQAQLEFAVPFCEEDGFDPITPEFTGETLYCELDGVAVSPVGNATVNSDENVKCIVDKHRREAGRVQNTGVANGRLLVVEGRHSMVDPICTKDDDRNKDWMINGAGKWETELSFQRKAEGSQMD
jgi:hypothetical protein